MGSIIALVKRITANMTPSQLEAAASLLGHRKPHSRSSTLDVAEVHQRAQCLTFAEGIRNALTDLGILCNCVNLISKSQACNHIAARQISETMTWLTTQTKHPRCPLICKVHSKTAPCISAVLMPMLL
jgi:hypothetical protein